MFFPCSYEGNLKLKEIWVEGKKGKHKKSEKKTKQNKNNTSYSYIKQINHTLLVCKIIKWIWVQIIFGGSLKIQRPEKLERMRRFLVK